MMAERDGFDWTLDRDQFGDRYGRVFPLPDLAWDSYTLAQGEADANPFTDDDEEDAYLDRDGFAAMYWSQFLALSPEVQAEHVQHELDLFLETVRETLALFTMMAERFPALEPKLARLRRRLADDIDRVLA